MLFTTVEAPPRPEKRRTTYFVPRRKRLRFFMLSHRSLSTGPRALSIRSWAFVLRQNMSCFQRSARFLIAFSNASPLFFLFLHFDNRMCHSQESARYHQPLIPTNVLLFSCSYLSKDRMSSVQS
jgi:hypothetical protein